MKIRFNEVSDASGLEVVPAERRRDWMDDTAHAFANRCLPMLMANQLGFDIRVRYSVRVHYDGTRIEIMVRDGELPANLPKSHFGGGVLTWSMPWLVTTPPGWDLLVGPPANTPRLGGITVLSGLVETDHTYESFTLNWRLEPGTAFELNPGDIIVTLLPVPTAAIQELTTEFVKVDPGEAHRDWKAGRFELIARTDRDHREWDRTYFRRAKRRKMTWGEAQPDAE